MKRIVTLLLTGIMVLASLVGFAGCTPPVPNDAQTLEIYCANFGYGYEWLNNVINLFKEQEWVNEKYPNLNIPDLKQNSERTFANERAMAGGNANTIDLFFACDTVAGYVDKTDASGSSMFEELSTLYTTVTIPGEEVTIAEKMNAGLLEAVSRPNAQGTKSYYAFPWVNGYMGILYNETLLKKYMGNDYILPTTTDKFISLLDTLAGKDMVNGGNSKCYPLISASKVNYWQQIFMTWWAQYEGKNNYVNYWEGLNDFDETDITVIEQIGRLRGLEVVEDAIGYDTNHNHKNVNTLEFTQAQAKFLLGEGIFMPNGDWFENEMRSTQQENPYDYDISYMKMPVISSIVETLEYEAMTDDELDTVIKSVDANEDYDTAKAKVSALTENDYARITEARNIMYTVEGHEAFIPSYATAKELAKDFLLFLSTDEAIECFMITTNGCSTAFNYDMQEKNETAYNNFMQLQKDRIAMTKTGVALPSTTGFRLNYYGGHTTFVATAGMETKFTAQNSADRLSAQQIYQADITYYNSQNKYNWDKMLEFAGLK